MRTLLFKLRSEILSRLHVLHEALANDDAGFVDCFAGYFDTSDNHLTITFPSPLDRKIYSQVLLPEAISYQLSAETVSLIAEPVVSSLTRALQANVDAPIIMLLQPSRSSEREYRQIKPIFMVIFEQQTDQSWIKQRLEQNQSQIDALCALVRDLCLIEQLQSSDPQSAGRAMLSSYNTVNKLFENLHDAIISIDESGTIKTANASVYTMFGYTVDSLIGRNISMLMPKKYALVHNDFIQQYLTTGRSWILGNRRELKGLHKSGREIDIELTLTEVREDNEHWFIGAIHDLTERKIAEKKAFELAYTDPITGLTNMAGFYRDCELLLSSNFRENTCIGLFVIELQDMSAINHSFGRVHGDKVFRKIGENIGQCLDNSFRVYRGEGDYFLVLGRSVFVKSNELEQKRLEMMAHIIQPALLQTVFVDTHQHHVATAMTILKPNVKRRGRNKSFESLIDYLLSQPKPRDSVNWFEEDDFRQYIRSKHISQSIYSALTNNEFHVVLQPIVDPHGHVHSSEMLIRWDSPELGVVTPVEFIPLAEQTNNIYRITEWILKQACILLEAARIAGFNTNISVNISAQDVMRHDFVDMVKAIIARYRVRPSQLTLEITESTLISEFALVSQRLEALSELGMLLAIDDFGTGYSNFAHLYNLPIHELKIDKGFIDNINNDDKALKCVANMFSLGRQLGIRTVAEGVSDEQKFNLVCTLDSDMMQGFYISRPLDKHAWLEFLRQRNA